MNTFRALVFCFLTTVGLFGQAGTGTISGSVFDSSGAAVPGASVVALREATGFRRDSAVNNLGEFSLIGLQPGEYIVTIEMQGFKKSSTKQVKLEVDQNIRIDVKLEVGNVAEVIEVTGQGLLLNTEQSSTGSVVDRQKIIDFPLNGRNFVQLALLLPGVNSGDGGNSNVGGGISISGMRPEQNSFLLDGTVNSDQYQNALVIRPSVDAIEEFKIQTSSYSAEFGKGAGGQINVVTRGGTNTVHGTLFEFNRNNALQARNLFDRNSNFKTSDGRFKAPPYNQNQFGFTLGGPVLVPKYNGKDRSFFFVNYEGYSLRRGNTTLTTVPTPEMKRGDFASFIGASQGTDALGRAVPRNGIYDARSSRQVGNVFVRDLFPGNIIPGNRFDPVSRNVINYAGMVPDPNTAGSRGANGNPTQNYFDGRTRKDNYNLFSLRGDHQFSTKDTLMARYSITDSYGFAPNTFPGYGSYDNQRQMAGTISETHVFGPSTVNEFKFGYLRWAQFQAGENTIADKDVVKELGLKGLDFASTAGLRGAPNFAISGFATIGDGDGPYRPRNNTYQFIDQFSFNKGRHFIKVGGEIRRVQNNITRANTLRGSFNFTSNNWSGEQGFANTGNTFANFLLGLAVQKGRRVSGFAQDLRSSEYAGFIQDDWKVSSKLTINMGIRYMYYAPPYEIQDRVSTLTYPKPAPTNFNQGALFFLTPGNEKYAPNWGRAGKELPRSLYEADKKNFGPRFGFAYRPLTKTVIRGGYGIFFDTVPLYITQDTLENLPNMKEDQQSLSLFQDSLPTLESFNGFLIANPGPGQFSPGPNNVSPNFKNAYVQHWNFGIQRELPGAILLEMSYVGSKGTRLNRRENSNSAEPNGPGATVPLSSIPAQPLNPITGQPFSPNPIENASLRSRFRRLVPYAINTWENNALYLLDNVFDTTSTAFSNYNSAQLRLEKRQSKGLTWLLAYTFSKALSDATGFNGGGPYDTGNRIQDMFNKKADKGLASIDHRHRLSGSVIYDLPFGKGKSFLGNSNALLNAVVGGWSLNGIYTYQTGLPLTVKYNGDVFGSGTDNARPDLVCNPNQSSDGRNVDQPFFTTSCFVRQSPIRYGTAGRSTVTGPVIQNIDIGVLKNNRITERFTTQFRAEFFNFPNHPQWNPPNRFVDQAAFGLINSARDPRIIQLGLKLNF